jgi:hypothetical protein
VNKLILCFILFAGCGKKSNDEGGAPEPPEKKKAELSEAKREETNLGENRLYTLDELRRRVFSRILEEPSTEDIVSFLPRPELAGLLPSYSGDALQAGYRNTQASAITLFVFGMLFENLGNAILAQACGETSLITWRIQSHVIQSAQAFCSGKPSKQDAADFWQRLVPEDVPDFEREAWLDQMNAEPLANLTRDALLNPYVLIHP